MNAAAPCPPAPSPPASGSPSACPPRACPAPEPSSPDPAPRRPDPWAVAKRPQRPWGPAPQTAAALAAGLRAAHGPAARVALRRLRWAGAVDAARSRQADRLLARQGIPARLQPSLLGEADTPL